MRPRAASPAALFVATCGLPENSGVIGLHLPDHPTPFPKSPTQAGNHGTLDATVSPAATRLYGAAVCAWIHTATRPTSRRPTVSTRQAACSLRWSLKRWTPWSLAAAPMSSGCRSCARLRVELGAA